MTKTYYFSAQKHAHDIEFYWNRVRNTMGAMESGEIPMDKRRYDRLCDMTDPDGTLMQIRSIMCCCGPVVQLTGEQIALAKKIVIWASETRAQSCIERGRYDLLKYC